MRALFLIPGDSSQHLQAFAAVAAVASQLQAQVAVVCPPETAPLWRLHPAGAQPIPFPFATATLADWANLLGTVREPDFQLCLNRASGRQVDLMLSMSHIPTRIATAGFSATQTVELPADGWGAQAWQALLQPIGVTLDADSFRLSLTQGQMEAAAADLPSGDGPLLLLAPAGGGTDWPQARWQALPDQIRERLPALRTLHWQAEPPQQQLARMAAADVVLASEPSCIELALMLGLPLVALGRGPAQLPQRPGVQGLGPGATLTSLEIAAVLQALGFQ